MSMRAEDLHVPEQCGHAWPHVRHLIDTSRAVRASLPDGAWKQSEVLRREVPGNVGLVKRTNSP